MIEKVTLAEALNASQLNNSPDYVYGKLGDNTTKSQASKITFPSHIKYVGENYTDYPDFNEIKENFLCGISSKNGKPFEGKRYINFHLNDGRVIVLEDKEKDDASPDKIMSDKGRIYQDGLQEGVFKTTLSSWKEAYCGQQVIIRAHGRKYRCYIH